MYTHFLSELNDMAHIRISGTESSSVILSQTCSIKSWKVMTKRYQKQAEAKRDGVINPQKELPRVDRARNPAGDDKIKSLVTWWY